MEALFGKTIDMLSTVMDFRSERHKVITSNIANIDTPNYKARDVVFSEELKGIIENGENMGGDLLEKGSSPEGKFEVVETGERVSLDEEMAKLAENNLMYNLAVELMARKFKGLDIVLKEAK